ncbi:hypothetical protein [Halobacillus salinus]|uniref:Uncharacterized protein n=1 Tax=Halobacillus salinus TaxID=192814 RepID=A0A4Z0H1Z7_9BACI|nr:hypothetical protein [Halobacillus salinus]TGB03426.1 hypothetical protein E4663_00005 [Halobacillus salinus]
MENNKLALFVSLFVLVGFPVLFLILSLITGDWSYLMWSIPPSILAGLTGLLFTLREMKKDM